MKKQLFFAVSMVFALVLSSCSKDLTALDPSLFKCNPNPLEVKGGKVDATVTGTFPVKYFNKNAVVTVTPVLKFEGKEVKGTPVVFQGEKVKGNDQTIAYKTGGNYSLKASFDYVPEMIKSELYLEFSIAQKSKTYQIPSVKVADGVIATSQLVSTNPSELTSVIIPDKFQRVIQQQQEADIMFLIQQSKLRKSETNSADMISLTKKIKEVKETPSEKVSSFDLSAYASPEGPLKLNTNLAESREKVTADFMKKAMKKLKTSINLNSKFTPEDWAGFQALMEKSNIQDKQVILRVLTMYNDPEERERQIKNLSVAFKQIAEEILPQLRRSKLKLTVDVTGKSDEEIAKLAKDDASKLTVDELLYAATLTNDLSEKATIYQKVTELFPTDVRGFNNLGSVKYQQGNVEDASRYFAKALEIDPTSADVNFNAGLGSLAKNDLGKAEEYFGKAAGTTGNVGQGLGTINIIRGDYSKAKSYFGSTATNNAALLQILNADYSGARNTLSAVAKPNATTSYLGAIIGARTNDRDAVYSNLKNAVKQDGSYASKAVKDIEFSKFATDETFLSIVK
ncbi:MAG: tetratricopeptide repeat protein [Bacteroidota bacterium]|nr:tetratricopeptide repeat protein [Bacteroidota bacterium]